MHLNRSFSASAFLSRKLSLFLIPILPLSFVFLSPVPVRTGQGSREDETSKSQIAGIAQEFSKSKQTHDYWVVGVSSTNSRAVALWTMSHRQLDQEEQIIEEINRAMLKSIYGPRDA